MDEKIVFCKGGGCTAKLGAAALSRVLELLPKGPPDPNLLIGYDSKDDAAVYKLTDDLAYVQTLDFFPPMVDDPYTFGKIAATNALSDIYAMGGTVATALNIVCFPESWDLNILGEIMRGGSEKVIEAGGTLAGGHSIADDSVKYGLSVTGIVHPDRIYPNNYIALDMLEGNQRHATHYTEADHSRFNSYVEQQLARIDLPQKDIPFLREKILLMYANPLKNKERRQEA